MNPNSGIINSLILFNCLEVLYASKTVKKSDEFLFVMKTEEAIREFINHICILDPDKFHGKRWERELILATIYTCYKNIPPENALDYIEDYYKVLKEHPRLMGNTGRKYSKKDFNRLDAFRNERNLN